MAWGYAIVGVGLNLEGAGMTTHISGAVLTIGVSTLLQARLAHCVAMVHGPDVIASVAIVAAGGGNHAFGSFTAHAPSGVNHHGLRSSGSLGYIRKVPSPLVLGLMIILIGLTVAQAGLGDMTQAGFGRGFFTGLVVAPGGSTLAICVREVSATLPPVFIVVLGYMIFVALRRLDLNLVRHAPWSSAPSFFRTGQRCHHGIRWSSCYGQFDGSDEFLWQSPRPRRGNQGMSQGAEEHGSFLFFGIVSQ